MIEHSPIPRLTDIVEAIELIRGEMAGVALKAFEPDIRKRWLVERGIEIISEASRRLPCRAELADEQIREQQSGSSPGDKAR
jgi:hypothetical protein